MMSPIDLCDLARAFGVDGEPGTGTGELISLVGGGGKTTSLFALGDQLAGTTVLTTTTKMGSEQSKDYPALIGPTDAELRARLLLSDRRALVWWKTDGRRAIGVSAETCDRWFDMADNVVVEADGSRKRPFKAPADHEPVIPSRTTLLVACIGAGALGTPIADCCHRPELVAGLAGCSVDDALTPGRAAAVLLHPDGSQKHRPAAARFVVALHRVGSGDLAAATSLRDQLGDNVSFVAVAERS